MIMYIAHIASGSKYHLYERTEKRVGQVTRYVSTLPEADERQVIALFRFILENGLPMNKEKFRHIGDQIYELKTRRGIRILGFSGSPLLQDTLILTHGLRKPKQKVLMREKEKTIRWRNEYFRVANKMNNFHIIEGES